MAAFRTKTYTIDTGQAKNMQTDRGSAFGFDRRKEWTDLNGVVRHTSGVQAHSSPESDDHLFRNFENSILRLRHDRRSVAPASF